MVPILDRDYPDRDLTHYSATIPGRALAPLAEGLEYWSLPSIRVDLPWSAALTGGSNSANKESMLATRPSESTQRRFEQRFLDICSLMALFMLVAVHPNERSALRTDCQEKPSRQKAPRRNRKQR
jgi:hypothetical protein